MPKPGIAGLPISFIAASVVSLALYILMGYFISRHQTTELLLIYLLLFCLYLWLLHSAQQTNFQALFALAIIFRLSLFASLPQLSDDLYRFIWDGRLWAQGINPFIHPPVYYLENPHLNLQGLDQSLFDKLNSPAYFSVYPPVNQFVFWISAWVFPHNILGSVMVMRSLALTAEIGILYLIKKLLLHFDLPPENLLIYALNPLVILELTGNLHTEVYMILFLLYSIYLLIHTRTIGSAISMALAVGSKLIPLIILPLMISRLWFKKMVIYYLVAGLSILLLFIPFISGQLLEGMGLSLSLYFQKFEFNASVYYIVREIGYWVKGYNIIESSGKWMAMATFLGIISYTVWDGFKKPGLPFSLLMCFTIFLIFSTTLHPWYITTLIAIGALTKMRFPIVWSVLIFFTYAGYSETGYQENLWIVGLEYIITFGYLIYELNRGKIAYIITSLSQKG